MARLILYIEKVKPPIRTIRTGIVIMLSLFSLLSARAQSDGEYSVKWIGQYPGSKGEKTATFGDRVSRIVFGLKPREVIKPFNMVAVNPDHYWILDQGAGGLFEVKKGEGALIRAMKRTEREFPSMVGICRLPGGDLLFTDSRLNKVVRVQGDQLTDFGESITLDQPTGIACNSVTGDIWVVETGAHRIAQFSKEGRLIRKTGSRGTGPGQFNFPTFIWIDQRGRIYIVDSMNYRIQLLDSEGEFLGSFGESGDATGYMARPKGIATDSKGHIYVADALFHAVQIFDSKGRFLYSFGNQGQEKGEFWMPAGLFIDRQDHIYVADSYNARVQVFQLEKNK
jgi:DNA-binding beta-propeller fold protein YncE